MGIKYIVQFLRPLLNIYFTYNRSLISDLLRINLELLIILIGVDHEDDNYDYYKCLIIFSEPNAILINIYLPSISYLIATYEFIFEIIIFFSFLG